MNFSTVFWRARRILIAVAESRFILRELTQAIRDGYGAYVLFVIQMADVLYLPPNDATDPAFGNALREAAAAGVQILAMDCAVTADSMAIRRRVAVEL